MPDADNPSTRPSTHLSTVRRRLELGRLLLGSLVEMFIKAYGAAAALAVALSDAETVGGKIQDAVRAIPSLAERYDQARYVVDHREQIQAAITYLDEHTVAQDQLEGTIDESTDTLDAIVTTYDEVGAARDVLEIDGISGTLDNIREAMQHVGSAYDARPDLDSLERLVDVAEQVRPLTDQVDVLVPVYYGGVLDLMDNFARDEIAGTVFVMAVAFGIAVVLGQAVGFWVRRGRPGLLAQLWQALGARVFRRWYVRNLPYALSPPLYDAAREHLQQEIVADPEQALDPETLSRLEEYFAGRGRD
jgi:tetratricopeptide (TPR) repeat protein